MPNSPRLSPSQARIQSFRVVPSLPEPLRPLLEIAHNLWWVWNHDAITLFSKLDRDLWEATDHNPVKMLGMINQDRLDRAATDRSYIHAINTVRAQLADHLQQPGWYGQWKKSLTAADQNARIAYFCAEFGLTECFQIYSGGLGGLSGDHLKSASELNIPLVAVGLLYRKGYFHQYLNPDGYQQEQYPDLDAPNQAVRPVIDPVTGQQQRVHVQLPGRSLAIGVWRCDVGKVPLYLLDTNMPENSREDRDITMNLYGGDMEVRIKQEIVLGIGGIKALAAVGEKPTVCHLNEGHAAFTALERIATLRSQNPSLTFDEVREAVAASSIFTTHTPVPAGIDRFPPRLIEQYLGHMLPSLGLDTEGLLALGRENVSDQREFFSMAVLALRCSRFANGVSQLHGVVSRSMWKGMWPGTPETDVPIGAVTNGVHVRTWLSGDFVKLFDRYLRDKWHTDPQDDNSWKGIDEIPDDELWRIHSRRREKLVGWVRRRLRQQLIARGAGTLELEKAASALDSQTLTIGFARRFATYKRGTLLFRDVERILRIVRDAKRPVQLIIAGKSHPADGGGKQLIRDIIDFIRKHDIQSRIVFIEDYDMHVCRRMVQGCDIWLNNPIRGLEASGTSGMKAAMNGVMHCSILDGWWDEAFNPECGYAIGRGELYTGPQRDQMDEIEARALYHVIESQIVPDFYERDSAGVPHRWVARMKACIKHLAPKFNTHRMVRDYTQQYYLPAHNLGQRLLADGLKQSKELSNQIDHFRYNWHQIRITQVESQSVEEGQVDVRSQVRVSARVSLGSIHPDSVQAHIYHGPLNPLGEMVDGQAIRMRHVSDLGNGEHLVVGEFSPLQSGQHGFSVRVIPHDARLATPFMPGLITWDAPYAPPASEAAAPAREEAMAMSK